VRRLALPALILTASGLLLAGCGDDDGGGSKDDKSTAASSAGASDKTDGSDKKSGKGSSDAGSESSGPTVPAKVTATAEKLGCDLADGTDGFDGETEYVCGAFLVADWETAGVTEDEMFNKISEWVDEKRPVWMYAGNLVVVYGTKADLESVADQFE